MARGHKLTDSISISELMHMREVEGLSNGEIARKLGCSINTIHAHIGTHPEGKRAKRKDKRKQLTSLPEKQIPDMPRESFKERCERLMAKAEESPTSVVDLMTKTDEKKTNAAESLQRKFAELRAIESELPILSGDVKVEAKRNAQQLTKEIAELGKLQTEDAPKEADKAREAHCKEMESARAAGDKMAVYLKSGDPKDIPHNATLGEISEVYFGRPSFDTRAHINELLAVFGPDVVRDYLRVALYALGIHDSRQVRREHLLDALNKLNKEAIFND